jgi:hypothetical protein
MTPFKWTETQEREALHILLRHVANAPKSSFGDTRERSAAIRASVHRMQPTSRLKAQLAAADLLRESATLSGQEKADVYNVSHALRCEIARRRAV